MGVSIQAPLKHGVDLNATFRFAGLRLRCLEWTVGCSLSEPEVEH